MGGYDTQAIVGRLHEATADVGSVLTEALSAGVLTALLISADRAISPIRIEIEEGECHMVYGSGARIPFGYGGPGDEEFVLDVVEAIISGNAWERFVLSEGRFQVLPRIVGKLHESAGGGHIPVFYERQVPVWPRIS